MDKYYTPKSLEEFNLKDAIEINYPEYTIDKGMHYSTGYYKEKWIKEVITSKILKKLEDWYDNLILYGDIDMSKRVRIKLQP